MAQMVVEKNPIGAFLDELPGLILQYKQLQFAEKERALDREERKSERAQGILIKEYYSKLNEVKTTEAVFDKYDNLTPSDISQGGLNLKKIVDNENNIDMEAITSNLDALSSYQTDLKSGLNEIRSQGQILKEMQADFAGANRVLDPHEYEAFQEHALKALEEGGLGWETTVGADVEYYKKDPTTRYVEALRITEKMKSDEDTGAKGNYAILQSMYTLGKNEDVDDLVERLSYEDAAGNTIEPSEEVVAGIQRMAIQPSYDDFITNLNAYPSELGGDLIRAELMTNPNTAMVYNNLQQNYGAIQSLDNELAGINEPEPSTRLDQFVSDISGITNKEALFGLYDQVITGLDPSEHGAFFNAIEAQLGGIDLGASYMENKGFATGGVNYSQQQLNQLKYERDFGDFQLEAIGEEGVKALIEELEPEGLRRDQTGRIHAGWEAPAENVNVALEKLDRLARLTDLNSQAYEEYLSQIAEE